MSDSLSKTTSSAPSAVPEKPVTSTRRRKWGWFLLWMSPLALLLLGPTIVARTSLRNSVVGWAAPQFRGKVDIGQAGLSWFAPVKIYDLAIRDTNDDVALRVPVIETDCTLWQLASGRYEDATIRIEKPQANLTIHKGGSNFEELLQPFLEPTDGDSGTASPIKIEVENGELTLVQTETGSRSQIRDINCTINQQRGCALPEIDLVGRWSAVSDVDGFGSGGITAALRVIGDEQSDASHSQSQAQSGRWHIETQQLAAGFLEPLVQRFYPHARMSGFINVDVKFDQPVDTSDRSFLAYGHIDCRNLAATVPELFAGDRLFFDAIDVDGRVDVEGDTVSFEQVNVDSSIFKLTADGDVNFPNASGDTNSGRDLEIISVVDLPSVASMMPETLRLHPELRVDAGRLLAQIGTTSTATTRNWLARLKVTQISGRHQDKTIQWEDPVSIALAATQADDNFTIDKVRCDSSFMKITGNGDADHVDLNGSCNLNVLMHNVSQFIETNDHTVAGQMQFDARWNRLADGQSTIAANATATDFVLQSPGLQPWREKQLTASMSARGVATLQQLQQVNQLDFSLLSQADRLTVGLIEPTTLSQTQPVPLQLTLTGDLNSWAARTSPFVNWGAWRPNGQVRAKGKFAFATNECRVVETTVVADDFSLTNGDIVVQDQHVEAKLTANFEYGSQHGVASLSITGRDVSGTATDVEFSLGEDTRMAGRVHIEAKLDSAVRLTNGLQIGGALNSTAELSNSGNQSEFALLGSVDNLQFTRPLGGRTRIAGTEAVLTPQRWVEPEFRFAAKGKLAGDVLQLEGFRVKTLGIGLTAQGTTSPTSSDMHTDFKGELGYDLTELSKALEVVLGVNIQATGTGRQPFQIRGPLFGNTNGGLAVSPELEAAFGIDWKTASIDQVSVGEGQIQARLEKQVLRFAPTSMMINSSGTLNVRPIVSLGTGQPIVHLNQETSLNNAVLTPELTKQWIGYVAPLLANTAEVDGRFSARVSKGTIPVWNMPAADISGELQIERADARPGPTAIKLIQLVRQVRTLLGSSVSNSSIQDKTLIHMGQQTALFRMVNGRIHHRGVQFEIDGVPIQTSGSVGIDQTMSITAEIPIRESWVKKDKLMAKLSGKKLSIPITGTASNPRVDNRVVADLARQIGQSAAQGLIDDKVNGALENLGSKLFGN